MVSPSRTNTTLIGHKIFNCVEEATINFAINSQYQSEECIKCSSIELQMWTYILMSGNFGLYSGFHY